MQRARDDISGQPGRPHQAKLILSLFQVLLNWSKYFELCLVAPVLMGGQKDFENLKRLENKESAPASEAGLTSEFGRLSSEGERLSKEG